MEEWSRCFLDTRPPSALERSSVDKDKDSSDRSSKVVPAKTTSLGIKTPGMILVVYPNVVITYFFLQVLHPTPIVPPKGESLQCIPKDIESQNGNPTQSVLVTSHHTLPEQSSLWNCSRGRIFLPKGSSTLAGVVMMVVENAVQHAVPYLISAFNWVAIW